MVLEHKTIKSPMWKQDSRERRFSAATRRSMHQHNIMN